MKKFKLMISTFCLAIVLTFAGGAFTSVYANDGGPQGESRSTQTTPQPPPPPPIVAIIMALLGLI